MINPVLRQSSFRRLLAALTVSQLGDWLTVVQGAIFVVCVLVFRRGVVGELRRNPVTASAYIIAVTGYGSDEDYRRSHEAGFDRHLVKPVDPQVLQQVLANVRQADTSS